MEKEILINKKQQLISNKEKIEENNCKIESLEIEKEDLENQYIEIAKCLDELNTIVYRYESLESSKKLKKICNIIAILCSPIIGIIAFNGIAPTVFGAIIVSIFAFSFIKFCGSIPYLISKQTINDITNLTLEEVEKQMQEKQVEKKLNIEKLGKNIKKIESLNSENYELEDSVYMLGLSLLKDKESRDEIMEEIIKEYPTDKLMKIITDSMLKINKVKVKK